MSLTSVFDITGSALHAQSVRLNTVASNLANADTISSSTGETYRARHPVFGTVERDFAGALAGVQVLGIVESQAPLRRDYQPGHPQADGEGYVTLPNVDGIAEMADMISAARSYQTNVEVMQASREMLTATLSLGR